MYTIPGVRTFATKAIPIGSKYKRTPSMDECIAAGYPHIKLNITYNEEELTHWCNEQFGAKHWYKFVHRGSGFATTFLFSYKESIPAFLLRWG